MQEHPRADPYGRTKITRYMRDNSISPEERRFHTYNVPVRLTRLPRDFY